MGIREVLIIKVAQRLDDVAFALAIKAGKVTNVESIPLCGHEETRRVTKKGE